MSPKVKRGRWLSITVLTLLILERLAIALLALSTMGNPKFSWTMVVMPLTHILVAAFLWITADQLIYLLVLLWGIITGGGMLYDAWDKWAHMAANLSPEDHHTLTLLIQNRIIFASFHLLMVLLLLLPSVRIYFAAKRERFEEMEEQEATQPPQPPAPPSP
jgi:hypothetical protein